MDGCGLVDILGEERKRRKEIEEKEKKQKAVTKQKIEATRDTAPSPVLFISQYYSSCNNSYVSTVLTILCVYVTITSNRYTSQGSSVLHKDISAVLNLLTTPLIYTESETFDKLNEV